MMIETYTISNVGKSRNNNEDAYIVSDLSIIDENNKDNIKIVAVLDGMGGIEGGELASSFAGKEFLRSIFSDLLGIKDLSDTIEDIKQEPDKVIFKVTIEIFAEEKNENIEINGYIQKDDNSKPITLITHLLEIYSEKDEEDSTEKDNQYKEILFPILVKAIKNCNIIVNNLIEGRRIPPGTTLTGAIFFKNKALVINIGDSRAYRFREIVLPSEKKEYIFERVTKDHSYVQELVDANIISLKQARHHPQNNIVTRCIGAGKWDFAEHFLYNVKPNDIYLFSSDGLHDMIDDDDIEKIIKEEKNDIKKIGKILEQLALDNGGFDNITIILARFYE